MPSDEDEPPTPPGGTGMAGAETHLRSILDHTPIALWALDARGIITLSEGKALEAMGIKPGQLVGASAFDLYRESPEILVSMQRALAGEEFSGVADSYGRSYETHYRPLRDASGELAGMLGVTMDITERTRAEKQREELQAQLLQVQKLESLGLLAGGIAHDFNNLLTAILGSASAASASLPKDSPVRASLETIDLAARRAATLTRQLLAYAGKGQFDVRALDLSSHARELGELLETTLARNVTVVLELSPSLPAISADVAQLQQIIMNLVINAAEAIGDKPGSVVIATGMRHVETTELCTLFGADNMRAGVHVFLEVRDTGPGMDEATRARIFDPFFSTKFAGRGLGLAAALGIVRAHQGSIEVESQPGRGSVFRVFFPVRDRASHADAASAAPFAVHGLALIVDDDIMVRRASRMLLESFGLTVLEAADGLSGIALCREHAADIRVVLLDVMMPGLGGEQTLRELRALRADLPVILASGYSTNNLGPSSKDDTFTRFLRKPFTRHDLADAVDALTQRAPGDRRGLRAP